MSDAESGAGPYQDGKEAYLIRYVDPEKGEHFYESSTSPQSNFERLQFLGVAIRPKGRTINSADSLDEFRENVEELALDVRWFDTPLPEEVADEH